MHRLGRVARGGLDEYVPIHFPKLERGEIRVVKHLVRFRAARDNHERSLEKRPRIALGIASRLDQMPPRPVMVAPQQGRAVLHEPFLFFHPKIHAATTTRLSRRRRSVQMRAMKTKLRDVPGGPPALGPYSLGVVAEGKFVFVSGQTPWDPATGKIERGSIARQTELVLENVKKILAAAGADFQNVVSSRVYLSELTTENFKEMNEVYIRYFGDSAPSRATIGTQLLGFDVEIECVACL